MAIIKKLYKNKPIPLNEETIINNFIDKLRSEMIKNKVTQHLTQKTCAAIAPWDAFSRIDKYREFLIERIVTEIFRKDPKLEIMKNYNTGEQWWDFILSKVFGRGYLNMFSAANYGDMVQDFFGNDIELKIFDFDEKDDSFLREYAGKSPIILAATRKDTGTRHSFEILSYKDENICIYDTVGLALVKPLTGMWKVTSSGIYYEKAKLSDLKDVNPVFYVYILKDRPEIEPMEMDDEDFEVIGGKSGNNYFLIILFFVLFMALFLKPAKRFGECYKMNYII